MIGLDTNILVRYLAQDDPVQSPRANQIIERRLTEENPGFISVVAMVETVWVLDRAYRLGNREVATAVERILQADTLVVENEQEVFAAMVALKEGYGSFADAIIGALASRAGCARILTFDRKALGCHDSRLRSQRRAARLSSGINIRTMLKISPRRIPSKVRFSTTALFGRTVVLSHPFPDPCLFVESILLQPAEVTA